MFAGAPGEAEAMDHNIMFFLQQFCLRYTPGLVHSRTGVCGLAMVPPTGLRECKGQEIDMDVVTPLVPSSLVPPSSFSSSSHAPVAAAYPTDSRERQKAQEAVDREAGVLADKRKSRKLRFVIEDHHDDCGEDLSSLGCDGDAFFAYSGSDTDDCPEAEDSSDDEPEHHDLDSILRSMLINNPCGWTQRLPRSTEHASTMHECLALLTRIGPGTMDIVEIMGGEGRCSKIAIRRSLTFGKNVDIVTGSDLRLPSEQAALRAYVATYRPTVVIMAPLCTPFGPLGRFNEQINYEGWYRSYEDWVPLAFIRGQIALDQLRGGRHFLCEKPTSHGLAFGSSLAIGYEQARCFVNCDTSVHDRSTST